MANSILNSLLAPYKAAIAGEEPDYQNDPLYASLLSQSPMGRSEGGPSPANLSGIEAQLYRGFLNAGRPDLAKMVGTSAFHTWLGQESGFDPSAVSAANNQGLANDGLFQVWRGHDFNSNGRFSQISPQRQARLVADYFPQLDPSDIRRYAHEINTGTYGGWG